MDVLLGDMIDVPMIGSNGRKCGMQTVCRWAYIPVEEDYVSTYFDRKAQDYEAHGYAACRNGLNEKFTPSTGSNGEPMIAVRTYTTVETALVNCFLLPQIQCTSV